MRCFIAIDIDKKIISRLAELQQDLRTETFRFEKGVKWVDPENVHMTLKFLGDIEDDRVDEICGIVSDAVKKYRSFAMNIKGVGWFGRPARVLWVGIEESEVLTDLQAEIENSLDRAGFEADRKGFSAHLTICRIKDYKAGKVIQALAKEYSDKTLGQSPVDAVYIYKSDLTSQGPIYTQMGKFCLRS